MLFSTDVCLWFADVYPKEDWDVLESNRQALAHASSLTFTEDVDVNLAAEDNPTVVEQSQDEPAGEGDANVLVLNIRSAKYPDPVRIPARRTATASKILLRYLQKVGEDAAAYDTVGISRSSLKKLKLSFDGEQIVGNAEVGEIDAEDDDVWDIVGL